MKKITKAILAVAGYGTRFLPATKNIPKEMLPIVDKPIVQYLVEEAVNSGITDIIMVTRSGQNSMEDHFDTNPALEQKLIDNDKNELLKKVKKISNLANFIFIRQPNNLPYGSATPMMCAKNLINKDESFVYMFGDDMVKSQVPAVKQLINHWKNNNHSPIVAVQEIPQKEANRYGMIKVKPNTDLMQEAIEKPDPKIAPKPYLAQFGRFILNKEILNLAEKHLSENRLGNDGEFCLTDIVQEYCQNNPVYVKKITGKWMTTGDPLRFLQTSVEYALDNSEIGSDFKKYLKKLDL